MGRPTREVRWKPNWRNLGLELAVIFVGVSSAFFVESYRERLAAEEDLRQATAGIVAELETFERRGGSYVEQLRAPIEAWRAADAAGERAVPELFLIPGSMYPPTAAWEAAVASGVASLYEPALRYRLGYFYSEFRGIHDNYARHVAFLEESVLPRIELGADAFYDESGRFDPAVRSRLRLFEHYVNDLERLTRSAGELAEVLQREVMRGEEPIPSEAPGVAPTD